MAGWSLIFAQDDYEKAITTAVLGGWDTDCNGANSQAAIIIL
jgi:hypothetical protein